MRKRVIFRFHNKKLLFLLLPFTIISMISTGCRKAESDIPVIYTGIISDVDSMGVTFHGKISNPLNQFTILETGFIWSFELVDKYSKKTIEYRKTSEAPDKAGYFSIRVEAGLRPGIVYLVRSYVKAASQEYTGNAVYFVSKGSVGIPSIDSVEPDTGLWGEILTINGNNFSQSPYDLEVRIGSILTELISCNDNELKVKVPPILFTSPANISVNLLGKITTAEGAFSISSPVIHSLSSTEGTATESVIINGEKFLDRYFIYYYEDDNYHPHSIIKKTEFSFNNIQITSTILSDTQAKLTIPDIPPGIYKVTAKNYPSISMEEVFFTILPSGNAP